jgi:putative ABC transport system permease protein
MAGLLNPPCTMPGFQTRLFLRVIFRNREVYFLKIITLGIAFACSTLILVFSINEFGYDRFHKNYRQVFRVLQRNNSESYNRNRLSSQIPITVFQSLKSDPLIVARIKFLNGVNVFAGDRHIRNSSAHAADPEIGDIFSFDVIHGALNEFRENKGTLIISSSRANQYFGTTNAVGRNLQLFAFADTINYKVVAVYQDFPENSHEEFQMFLHFDSASIETLNFNYAESCIYGRQTNTGTIEQSTQSFMTIGDLSYRTQPISEIYFGPRVLGEDAMHGDEYSIIILLCIVVLILFLALTSFINLTTLTLPNRAKEIAVKKLAGTSQGQLVFSFVKESFFLVGLALVLSIALILSTSSWINEILSINVIDLFLQDTGFTVTILAGLCLVVGASPVFLTLRFTRATPIRLLSAETITFPRLKRSIIFLQLGISIFLIVASMVIRRQIAYSLLKEPGRNHDQIIYVSYPEDLTNEGLISLRNNWKKINANVIDVMATSQLPDQVSSKELNSPFYFMQVDRGFKDFFGLEMVEGNWFDVNDGDSVVVVNESGNKITNSQSPNVVGVFKDIGAQFNLPERPVKIFSSSHFNYNFLCIRVLEVDIRRTVAFFSRYFQEWTGSGTVTFLNKRFEEWLNYQDKLNRLSAVLAIVSGILSCCAIYGLSISIVRDKLKQIAIHKLLGASTISLTRLLVKEFASQTLWAILVFGPVTYIILTELLRTFVYATSFKWTDPLVPLAYCATVITLLCTFQTLSLNREDLSSALKR